VSLRTYNDQVREQNAKAAEPDDADDAAFAALLTGSNPWTVR
jgi:hypothetical protein